MSSRYPYERDPYAYNPSTGLQIRSGTEVTSPKGIIQVKLVHRVNVPCIKDRGWVGMISWYDLKTGRKMYLMDLLYQDGMLGQVAQILGRLEDIGYAEFTFKDENNIFLKKGNYLPIII